MTLEIQQFYSAEPYPFSGDYHDFFGRVVWPQLEGRHPRAILDAGCGTGGITASLARAFPDAHVVGIDFSGPSIARAREVFGGIHNISFLCGDITIPDGRFRSQFDLIYCQGVLHHLRDPGGALRALRQWTTGDGIGIYWLYNPYGRRAINDVIDIERTLGGPSLTLDERLKILQAILRDADLDAPGAKEIVAGDHVRSVQVRRKVVDRYLNPYSRGYTVKEASALLQREGWSPSCICEFSCTELPERIESLTRTRGELDAPLLRWSLLEVIHKPRGLTYICKRT